MSSKKEELNHVKRDELSYAAYYGLQEVVVSPNDIFKAITDRVEIVSNAGFCRPNKKGVFDPKKENQIIYNYVKIADTFFSDAFPASELKTLFEKAKENSDINVNFNFLLLDPFSRIAATRANALQDEDSGSIATNISRVYRRINKGLRKIIEALHGVGLISQHKNTDEFEDDVVKIETIKEQLELIKSYNESDHPFSINLKFIDTIQELPFYVVGPYVFKGVSSPLGNSLNNHWSIYIDDIAENNDIWDFYSGLFDKLFNGEGANVFVFSVEEMIKKIESAIRVSKTIFIGYGHKQDALDAVSKIVEKEGYIVSTFESVRKRFREEGLPELIPNIVDEAVRSSSAGILIFTSDVRDKEEKESGEMQKIRLPSLNVAHELGLCQVIHGADRTAVVAEKSAKAILSTQNLLPSNEDGKLFIPLERGDDQQLNRDSLENKMRDFFKYLNK